MDSKSDTMDHDDILNKSMDILTSEFNQSVDVFTNGMDYFDDSTTSINFDDMLLEHTKKQQIEKDNNRLYGLTTNYTNEEFIELLKNKYGDAYDYSNVRFVGYNSQIKLICRLHGPFIKMAETLMINDDKIICLRCIKECKQKMLIEKLKEKFGDLYDYSEVIYNTVSSQITLKCKIHGPFTKNAHGIIYGHTIHGCLECVEKQKNDEFIAKLKDKLGHEYDYSDVEFKNSGTNVTIKCRIHGPFIKILIVYYMGKINLVV